MFIIVVMVTDVHLGIKISVDTVYRQDYSIPHQNHYLFSYEIFIENMNDFPVQLLRRHWFIKDSLGENREVEGEGVVGEQPILYPGESHRYQSACNLKTDFGSMTGTYLFKNLQNGEYFNARIPQFKMGVPFRLN